MRIECIHSAACLAGIAAQIDAVNLAAARPDPFATCEFYLNFLRRPEFADDRVCLWFLAAFEGSELIGYLALKETTARTPFCRTRVLDCLVGHEGDRPQVMARPAHLAAVIAEFYAWLQGCKRGWDLLELPQQDDTSALYPLPPEVRLTGYWVRDYPDWDNCTLDIRWNSLRDYFAELSKRFRSATRRQMRRLLTHGQLELLTSDNPHTTPALFELYRSIESRSWKARTAAGIASSEARADYFLGLLDARQPMRIVIQILLLDGVPIAGLISGSFVTPSVRGLYALQIAFDDRLSAASPGSVMLLLGIRHAIEGRYAFFNLLAGFGYYKSRWLARATPTRCAQIYRIGSMRFWRRICGDLVRLLRRAGGTVQNFNPLRRAQATQADEDDADTYAVHVEATTAQRDEFSRCIASAHVGHCEHLSYQELLAALPFELSVKPTPESSHLAADTHRLRPRQPVVAMPQRCDVAQ